MAIISANAIVLVILISIIGVVCCVSLVVCKKRHPSYNHSRLTDEVEMEQHGYIDEYQTQQESIFNGKNFFKTILPSPPPSALHLHYRTLWSFSSQMG